MFGYQMVGIADDNGRTYESQYGTYSKETGFVLSEEGRKISKSMLLDKMFHDDCWSLKNTKKRMSKKEIEDILGYEIEISDFELTEEDKDEIKEKIKKIFRDDEKDSPLKRPFSFWL